MNNEQLRWLWGKTDKDKEGKQRADVYHPLLFHLLDVGHVARLLWREVLSARTREVLCAALGLDEDAACRLVTWLAAAHDIGKACPGFQFQKRDDKFGPKFLWQRLEVAGLYEGTSNQSAPHGFVSAKTLLPLLSGGAAKVLSHVVGAHHGTFPQSSDLNFCEAMGDEKWGEARQSLLRVMNLALFEDDAPPPQCGDIRDPALVPLLAGLISIADWIGSSKQYFSANTRENQRRDIREYSQHSQDRAHKALQEFGWLPRVEFGAARASFQELFDFEVINPLQRQVEVLSARLSERADAKSFGKPFLLIAEAPMGGGKTEAALWISDVALCENIARGFYLALPTQATSNAMFDRLRDDYFAQRGHRFAALQLAHGNALLHESKKTAKHETLTEVEFNPIDQEVGKDGRRDASVAAQSWFSGRKQTLLAPFGVGTIDQSLLGALQTSHWFVRLFGLAGKVVIFDEVHAYDTYMSALLERLLQWLRVLDCSVILLSATLPKSKRHALIEAWGAEPPSIEKPYPRLTWATSGEVATEEAESIAISDETSRKTVTLDFQVTDNELKVLCATLRAALAGEDGGCAAVICNTVQRAQDVYQILRKELDDLVPPDEFHLLHARMPFAWRLQREETILAKFGKKKLPRPECEDGRPHRAIVVGTQILEQSLDLDFDWMASEMAPVDLLLQRLGRLHRHEKDEEGKAIVRPRVLASPRFVILCDAERGENGAPPEKFGAYENTVYERSILLRSWLALREKSALELPREIETLINEVYDEAEPEGLDGAWQEALNKASTAKEKNENNAFIKADLARIAKPKNFKRIVDPPPKFIFIDDEDPRVGEDVRAATRDGRPSIQVVCLCEQDSKVHLPVVNDGALKLGAVVNLDDEPELQTVKELMRVSLPISLAALFKVLVKEEPPESWKKDSHLRFCRVLKFRNGKTRCGANELNLHPLLGLKVAGPEKETE